MSGAQIALIVCALFIALAEMTRLRIQLRRLQQQKGDYSRSDPQDFDRGPYFKGYKEQPYQRRLWRNKHRKRKEANNMSKPLPPFGAWQVTDELFEVEVKDRNGNAKLAYLREFSEEDLEKRDSVMIDQGKNRKARRGQAAGSDITLKVENRRKFDVLEGVKEWDFQVAKTNKSGDPIDEDGNVTDDPEMMIAVDLPCNYRTKMNLPGFVSEQLVREVRELNDLPVEDEDLDKEEDDKDSDDPYMGNGSFNTDNYFGEGSEANGDAQSSSGADEENVSPLEEKRKTASTKRRTSKSKPVSSSNS